MLMNQNTNMDITEIPHFKNHNEARDWFKQQYGDSFLLRMTDVQNGKKVMYYHFIKDPEIYMPYMESFASSVEHEITNMEVFKSYSTITIDEDGNVRLVDQQNR